MERIYIPAGAASTDRSAWSTEKLAVFASVLGLTAEGLVGPTEDQVLEMMNLTCILSWPREAIEAAIADLFTRVKEAPASQVD